MAVTVTYDAWATPGYTGPDPIEYWSLNNLDGITLMIGTGQGNYDPLVTGKVGIKACFNSGFTWGGAKNEMKCLDQLVLLR